MSGNAAGEFERLVMLAVLRLGEGAYGASVLEELESRSGRRVKGGAVYVALKRLERKGFITSELGEPTPRRGGRAKRLVSLTPEGLDELRQAHAEWGRMTAGLDTMLEGA